VTLVHEMILIIGVSVCVCVCVCGDDDVIADSVMKLTRDGLD